MVISEKSISLVSVFVGAGEEWGSCLHWAFRKLSTRTSWPPSGLKEVSW